MLFKRPAGRPRFRRRQYVIDRATQFGVAGHVIGALAVVAVLYALAVLVFLGRDARASMSTEGVVDFLLWTNTVYFLLAAIILVILVIFLTHRFTGPAWVISQALDGMMEGEFDRRLTLRRRDYLKNLAKKLDLVRARWLERERALAVALQRLERSVAKGDAEEVQRSLGTIRRGTPVPLHVENDVPAEAPEAVSVAD